MEKFLIGADPELFLQKDGKFVSVEDSNGPLIPGTKRNPHEVQGGAIQVDGVAAEFNVNPSDNFKDFYENIKSVVTNLRSYIKRHDDRMVLAPIPTAFFDPEYFSKLPMHTRRLGCDPDFDAYKDGAPNPRPKTKLPMRTGAGHIHFGWTTGAKETSEGHMADCIILTKVLDKVFTFAQTDWDNDRQRMRLYGKPGSFRPKPYGMEYRPTSNAWVKSPEVIYDVFRMALGSIRALDSGQLDLDFKDLAKSPGETKSEKVLNYLGGYIYDL